MTYRHSMLLLSIVTAVGIHAALYFAAPHIYLLRANSTVGRIETRFNVSLTPVPLPDREPWRALDQSSSRPESVRDLLRRETEMLYPDTFERERAALPGQMERLSEGVGEREHDLQFDPDKLRTMEARILEIDAKDARDGVEVARRVVSPSEQRVLGPGDLPTLRGEDAEGSAGAGAFFSPIGSSFDAQDGAGGGRTTDGGANSAPTKFDEMIPSDGSLRPDLPALGVEDMVARDPIKTAIQDSNAFERLDESVEIGVRTYIDPATGEGYFKVSIAPSGDATIDPPAKEVTFVLDASKSIGQRKLDAAVEGVSECLREFMPGDRFNVIVFRDSPSYFRPELVPATAANTAAAVDFLENLESTGSTDVYTAMRSVMGAPAARGVSDFIVLVSDGRPTGDSLAGRDLINALTEDNTARRTIYTIGAGTSANRYLLDLLAYRNKGMAFVSAKSDTLDEDIPDFFERVREPVLVDLSADYGRIPRDEIFPKEVPDFYRGREVAVYGKFDPEHDAEMIMRLHGRAGAQEKELVFKAGLSAADTGDAAIAKEWAFQKSYSIIGEICAAGESPLLVDELNRLSRIYGVRTSYTP